MPLTFVWPYYNRLTVHLTFRPMHPLLTNDSYLTSYPADATLNKPISYLITFRSINRLRFIEITALHSVQLNLCGHGSTPGYMYTRMTWATFSIPFLCASEDCLPITTSSRPRRTMPIAPIFDLLESHIGLAQRHLTNIIQAVFQVSSILGLWRGHVLFLKSSSDTGYAVN